MNSVMPPPQKKEDENWKRALGILQIAGTADSLNKNPFSNENTETKVTYEQQPVPNDEYQNKIGPQPNTRMAMQRRYNSGGYA